MRVEILVRPNASTGGIGGRRDGALVVRVVEPPERGRATRAALRAVARAFGVPPQDVTLVRGPTGRRKVVEISARGEQAVVLQTRLGQLLGDEDR